MINSKIQIIAFLFSFLFGIFFCLIYFFIKLILKEKNVVTKLIIDNIFVIDMVFIYAYFMYKINYGNYHIYYILMICLGWLSFLKVSDYVKLLSILKNK